MARYRQGFRNAQVTAVVHSDLEAGCHSAQLGEGPSPAGSSGRLSTASYRADDRVCYELPSVTVTDPDQAGISASVPGVMVANSPLVPGPIADRMVRLPRLGSETEHSSFRTRSLAMCTSVSTSGPAGAAGGTNTTRRAPTCSLTAGAGEMSLRVMDGEPGDGEHDVPIGVVVVAPGLIDPVAFVGAVVVAVDEPDEPQAATATLVVATIAVTSNLRPVRHLERFGICTTSFAGQPRPHHLDDDRSRTLVDQPLIKADAPYPAVACKAPVMSLIAACSDSLTS
jgi:hypothetical protein